MDDKTLLHAIRTIVREEVKAETDPLKVSVDKLETKVTGLETKVDGLDTKVTNLETKVTRLETDVAELKENVSGLDAKVTNLETKVDGLEKDLQQVRDSQLRVELEQYPRIAAALEGVVSMIEKNKAQDERITVLERKTDNHGDRILAIEYALKAN